MNFKEHNSSIKPLELDFFLHVFQNAIERIEAIFPNSHKRSFQRISLNAMINSVSSQSRLQLIFGGRFYQLFVLRLLCLNGKCAVSNPRRLGISALSRRHSFNISQLRCQQSLAAHYHYSSVNSIVFDSKDPTLLATCSSEGTGKLWKMTETTNYECVAIMSGHIYSVTCIVFHPNGPFLVTCSNDGTIRVWKISHYGLMLYEVDCVAILREHSDCVLSLSFQSRQPLLVSSCRDSRIKLWHVPPDGSKVTCVDTLEKHHDSVNLVVFDSKNPTLLATCSSDKTTILWKVSHSNSKATCVIILEGHSDWVLFAEFHKKEPILATGSRDMSVRLWHVPPDCSKAFCMATLDGQGCSVNSLAFHNEALLLAITSDKGAKLLRISSNGSTAICVATLGVDDRGTVSSIAFDPREPYVVTGSNIDGTIKRYPL